MTLDELKAVAERFRAVADDLPALDDLANEVQVTHPHDSQVNALCDRFRSAPDGGAVRRICDDIAARTH